MDALEKCHQEGFLAKATGKCTPIKQELSACLDATSMARRRRKIKQKLQKRKEFEKAKKELYEEEYGKDGYLKKVIEKENEIKKNEQRNI